MDTEYKHKLGSPLFKKSKAVIVLSGGMDSSTLLYDLIQKWEMFPISFNYKQRHKIELEYAKKTAKKLGLVHKVIDISNVNQVMEGSSLTRKDIEVPEGHYEEENMKLTVVPNRNMIMLSIATAYAVSIDARTVFFGAHAGDHAVYPDCRQDFIDKLTQVTQIANYVPVKIKAPYINLTKGQIAAIGKTLKVDYSLTHTCYKGQIIACGKCGACQERLEAFQFAKHIDPLKYVSKIKLEKKHETLRQEN